jgi:hypothetical protein
MITERMQTLAGINLNEARVDKNFFKKIKGLKDWSINYSESRAALGMMRSPMVKLVDPSRNFEIKIFDDGGILKVFLTRFARPGTAPIADEQASAGTLKKTIEKMLTLTESEKLDGDEISEARKSKKDYEIYHKSFTSAITEVLEFVKKNGYELNEDEFFNSVTTGPKKPSEGKTNKYSLNIYKNGVEQRKSLNFQVYGMSTQWELNMYIG